MTKSATLLAGLLGISLTASAVFADERLTLLKNVSRAGAPALTLKMLDQAQPSLDADLYGWILWEQERFAILSRWQQWDELLVRIEAMPVDIPEQFRQQTATYQARAFLELDQTEAAREVLREQMWRRGADQSAQYQLWRRMVISSYLRDGRIDDARIAMLRFDQDFASQDIEWLLLRARVLIESGRDEQALQVLDAEDDWQASLVRLYAQHRLDLIDRAELWRRVETAAEAPELSAENRASLWGLGYLAAREMSPVDRVVALESLFRSGAESPLELFRLPVDRLWQAYLEYAELVGNRAELLLGDDDAWLQLARQASQATPVKARSLFAMLMLNASDTETGNAAASGYLATFAEIDSDEHHLLDGLFNRSETFPSARDIPPVIRYQLVDLALASGDIDEATRLMSGLTTPPEGANRFDWQLRQSRVLVLGGQYDEGDAVLRSLLQAYVEPSVEATDRVLQVLFDLQTVGLHDSAIAHFNRLLQLELDPRQRREILFWIADSFRAEELYDQAALLYLQSAMLPGPNSMDPWAQTARFNAAESLQLGGLVDDARRVYEELLRVTEEAARRSVLQNKIQQLWLTQSQQ